MWPARLTTQQCLDLNWDANFCRRHLAVTTLGIGGATALGKACNTQHAAALESGTWEGFCKLRKSVRVWSSDQGVDAQVVDSPCLLHENFSNLPTLLKDRVS